ncbi:MAG: alpha-N-arabinofuranosidase, partial [Oscillospiraceae bacterium]|nr:alpha-N-arabinofuranosidase [Oscillospiraceae bacterium]
LFTDTEKMYTGGNWGAGMFLGSEFPRITQDEADADQNTGSGYITNMTISSTAGFKFFDCRNSKVTRIRVRGYGNGVFEVRTKIGGEILGTFPVENYNYWTDVNAEVKLPDGTNSLFFTFNGNGNPDFAGFELTEE